MINSSNGLLYRVSKDGVATTIARSDGDLYLPNARFTTPPTPDTEYWVTGIGD